MERQMVFRLVAPILISGALIAVATRGDGAGLKGSAAATVKYFGHCCFLIESPRGVRILIDPYEPRAAGKGEFVPSGFPTYVLPESEVAVDAVLVSHEHSDHNYGGTDAIQSAWGMKVPVLTDGDLILGDVHAVGMAGKHSTRNGNQEVKNVIWSVDIDGYRIVHWGDNAVPSDAQMRLLVKDGVRPNEHVDLLLLPIDGGCHLLSFEDVDRIAKAVKPSMLSPMHYVIPELQQGVAALKLDSTDWKGLGWGPLEPWVRDRKDVVKLDSNQLVLDDRASLLTGKVVVFKWPTSK
jgi:L-ascorbate metabolism protein UlaG (beta-lactamase superfamily)